MISARSRGPAKMGCSQSTAQQRSTAADHVGDKRNGEGENLVYSEVSRGARGGQPESCALFGHALSFPRQDVRDRR